MRSVRVKRGVDGVRRNLRILEIVDMIVVVLGRV